MKLSKKILCSLLALVMIICMIPATSLAKDKNGKADLICKQDGIICGLGIFERTFKLLDENSHFETDVKDGDFVTVFV